MNRFFLLITLLCSLQAGSQAQTVLPLYEVIPNSKPVPNRETSALESDGRFRVRNVTQPTLTVYVPATVRPGAAAVLICPGGGYGILAAGHEGEAVARRLNEWGLVAAVLKYRLPSDSSMPDKSIGPLQDAQRAIQLLRQRAGEWQIDPGKIGILGFSAGGHLAATASTQFQQPVIANPNGLSLRPDFSMLIYPVISFTDSLVHKGSRNNLLGPRPTAEQIARFSNELQVTAQTPKTFLVHSGDDASVPVGNSIAYYQALQRHKIPAELHIYEKGGHGYGMHNKTTQDEWMERLKNWLRMQGLLD